MVRITNDNVVDVTVRCFYRTSAGMSDYFTLEIPALRGVWFNTATGQGTVKVHGIGSIAIGELICWAVDPIPPNPPIVFNHLAGTATVMAVLQGAVSEYDAASFTAGASVVKSASQLLLNGVDYSMCPLYLIGHFTPFSADPIPDAGGVSFTDGALAVASCTQGLAQLPTKTKLVVNVWNDDGTRFTAWRCIDTWERIDLGSLTDADGRRIFSRAVLGTESASYRVQGVASADCEGSQDVGLVGAQLLALGLPTGDRADTGVALDGAGTRAGAIAIGPRRR